jgi:hypothetical protein
MMTAKRCADEKARIISKQVSAKNMMQMRRQEEYSPGIRVELKDWNKELSRCSSQRICNTLLIMSRWRVSGSGVESLACVGIDENQVNVSYFLSCVGITEGLPPCRCVGF